MSSFANHFVNFDMNTFLSSGYNRNCIYIFLLILEKQQSSGDARIFFLNHVSNQVLPEWLLLLYMSRSSSLPCAETLTGMKSL